MSNKLSYQEIRDFINGDNGNHCNLLTTEQEFNELKYNSKTKLKISCKCGSTFYVSFNNFKQKKVQRCNECYKRERIFRKCEITYEQILEKFNKSNNKSCILLTTKEEYIENKDNKNGYGNVQLRIRCKCGNIFETTLTNFIKNDKQQCEKCSKLKIRHKNGFSYDKLKNDIENNKLKLLTTKEEYDNLIISNKPSKIKLSLECSCGNKFQKTYSKLKSSGFLCQKCLLKLKGIKERKTHEEFTKQVFDLVSNEYSILNKYIDAKHKIKFKHNCKGCNDNVFEMIPNDFLIGQRCPVCSARKNSLTIDEIKNKVSIITDGEYEVIDNEFIPNHYNVSIFHKKCNRVFTTNIMDFISAGTRCPYCRESKGEKIITKYLQNNNIEFKPQYRFQDCRDKLPLPFDFGILESNKLKCLIEYDGLLHYEPYRNIKNADKKLEITQYHDKIKNNYCSKKDIPLLRIPYWEKNNIENILRDYL